MQTHDLSFKEKIEKIESDSVEKVRRKLMGIEGKYSEAYFRQVFNLLPEKFRPDARKGFKAYDGMNNSKYGLSYQDLNDNYMKKF